MNVLILKRIISVHNLENGLCEVSHLIQSDLCQSVGSHKVSVFGLRFGYPRKKFLFYLQILPFYENFELMFSHDHNPTHLKEIVIII